MKVYISGKWEARRWLRDWAGRVSTLGYDVTSSWLNEEGSRDLDLLEQQVTSGRGIREITASDLLILDTFDLDEYGGREVEMGVALACHIPIVIVGPPRNIFHSLAIRRLSSWSAVLDFLAHPNT